MRSVTGRAISCSPAPSRWNWTGMWVYTDTWQVCHKASHVRATLQPDIALTLSTTTHVMLSQCVLPKLCWSQCVLRLHVMCPLLRIDCRVYGLMGLLIAMAPSIGSQMFGCFLTVDCERRKYFLLYIYICVCVCIYIYKVSVPVRWKLWNYATYGYHSNEMLKMKMLHECKLRGK
jgi:hypothetical protein